MSGDFAAHLALDVAATSFFKQVPAAAEPKLLCCCGLLGSLFGELSSKLKGLLASGQVELTDV
jgi:hypothetical protein